MNSLDSSVVASNDPVVARTGDRGVCPLYELPVVNGNTPLVPPVVNVLFVLLPTELKMSEDVVDVESPELNETEEDDENDEEETDEGGEYGTTEPAVVTVPTFDLIASPEPNDFAGTFIMPTTEGFDEFNSIVSIPPPARDTFFIIT